MKKEKEKKGSKGPETFEAEKPLTKTEQKDVAIVTEVIQSREIAPQDAFGKLNRKQVDLIKRTVAQGASDDELRLFIQICKGANLNPFLRQAHLVPFWDSKNSVERRAIIIGIDGFRAIAESTGQYAGNDDPVFEGEDEIEIEKWGADKKLAKAKLTVPKKATVTVYKIVAGIRNPFTASARWSEYYPGGKKAARWNAMPYLMLGKCAEALALRKAFPKQLSGMYEESEIQQNPEQEAVKRTATAFDKLMTVAKTATVAELEDYKAKIAKSDKYTAAQKKEFATFADERIAELAEVDGQEVAV